MTNVSDELVEQAMAAAFGDDPALSDGDDVARMRAALSAVLPVIERPWQEQVEHLREALDAAVSRWEDAEDQLAERDQEIERLERWIKDDPWKARAEIAERRLLLSREPESRS